MSPAPALTFAGWMETMPGRPSIELWNVEHADGRKTDTLSRKTLEAQGHTVPSAPVPDPALQPA